MSDYLLVQLAVSVEYADCTCRGVRPSPMSVLFMTLNNLMVMLELRGMLSTPALPLLPGPLWPGMVAPDRALSLG